MRGIIVRWLVNALALLFTTYVIKGVEVDGVLAALIAAAVLGVINAFVRPVLVLLTLPINLLTLGLFTFVLNGFLFMVTSSVVRGFSVSGFWAAVIGSLVFSLTSSVIIYLIGDRWDV